MSDDLVRPSRDGDQFHYHWAARRCLRLLPPNADLVSIAIEGVSAGEGAPIGEGVDSIDVAEYKGSKDLAAATGVRYLQLKHSTRHAQDEWTLSGLRRTLQNFAARYQALVQRFGEDDVEQRFSFEFVTNRPFAASLITPLELIRAGTSGKDTAALERATGLSPPEVFRFVRLLALTGSIPGYLDQRSLLAADAGSYLPDRDADAPLQLKELVTRRATTEFEDRPDITRLDVLKALGADEHALYPAPSLIEVPPVSRLVKREQLPDLTADIVSGAGAAIVRADGGEGKSVLATCLGAALPAGSETFVYDCFGNGAYRSASGYRHRCRDGLVQLANEMAGRALCDPLIPTRADDASFVRAFRSRVEAAAAFLAGRGDEAILCLVIDAADNAEMAARELHDGPSFPRLLLRETWPRNVRLVLTARPHRVEFLLPPAGVPLLDLEAFSREETAKNLRAFFPEASEADVGEFHRLTSRNPRVQAAALAEGGSLSAVLRRLGGEPLTVEDLIEKLLEKAVARVRADAPEVEQPQIDQVCAALATLRPFVPLDVVASTAGVPVALVRSLINDLQHPLLVREDAVQFRDEPTETWFRRRFRPSPGRLGEFVDRLLPLAAGSAYVAAALPQLMLEAGRFDQLVALALSGEALPSEGTIARRDVELQRLQFALKAALRDRRYAQAAKLALKAGGEAAADARQQRMLSSNTDLGARFLEADQMLEQVTRRLIRGGAWSGSDHAYEAGFLSGAAALAGDARRRLRIAYDWLNNWARGDRARGRQAEKMASEDIAELALAEMNLHDPDHCASMLRRWRRREVSFEAGRLLAARLVDAGRFAEINSLALAAGNDLGLLLALVTELAAVGRTVPPDALRRTMRLVGSRHVTVRAPNGWRGEDIRLQVITEAVVAAANLRVCSRRLLASILTRYLPPHPPLTLGGRYASLNDARGVYLRAYCLRAALRNRRLTVEDLIPLQYRPRRRRGRARSDSSSEGHRLRRAVEVLLPWHTLFADVQLERVSDDALEARIAAARDASKRPGAIHIDERETVDEAATLWAALALGAPDPGGRLWQAFDAWRSTLERPLYAITLENIARRAAHTPNRAPQALSLAKAAFDLFEKDREHAESKADFYVRLARAVLPVSESEARAYFEHAIQISSKTGEENLPRWEAMLSLADTAGGDRGDRPELAYRFSRAAELTYAYVDRDKHFDWEHSIDALVALSPTSGPAVLSRWIDRRFATEDRVLPDLVDAVAAAGWLDPRDAIAFLPIDGRWPRSSLFDRALKATVEASERSKLGAYFLDYARLSRLSGKEWLRTQELLVEHGLDGAEAAKRAAAAAKRDRQKGQRHRHERRPGRSDDEARDWDTIFDGVAVTDPAGLAIAHERFRAGPPPYYLQPFYRTALSRLQAGEEAAFLDALRLARHTRLYDVRELLEIIPPEWKARVSVRPAMAAILKEVCRRECDRVHIDRYWEPIPWALAEELGGVTRAELVREAVTAIGETTIPAEFSDLFRLAALLSQLISPEEAVRVLDYGLDLLQPSLGPDDGDGPWTPVLAPPHTVGAAFAGYVWAALGSPWASRRWEAAHVVRAMFRLDCSTMIDALMAFAQGPGGGAFAAPSLHFYRLHALEWLVIALRRAAAESGAAVAAQRSFLAGLATRDNPHVVIRMHAAEAMLALHAQGLVALEEEERFRFLSINRSSLPIRARPPRRSGVRAPRDRPLSEERFLFGHDFGEHWIAPLGRLFGLTVPDLEVRAEKVIRDEWGLDENGHYVSDARAVGGFFRDEEMSRLYGSYPRSDNLSFYLSYHALMTVAGRLLETVPLVGYDEQENEEEDAAEQEQEDSFDRWLDRHRLTRADGLWLSDRRDPVPDDIPPGRWPEAWPAEVGTDYLGRLLEPRRGRMVASGRWSSHRGRHRERVRINSVLASSNRSLPLALALQTARNHDDYRLPTSDDDDDQIDREGWQLKAWLRRDGREPGIDKWDPWAEGLSADVPAPGTSATESLGLTADAGERRWIDGKGVVRLLSEVWSDGAEDRTGEWLPDQGCRLVGSRTSVDRLMRKTGLDLIVEMRVHREVIRSRYDSSLRSERENEVHLTQIYLLRPGQAPFFVQGGRQSRRGTRRRARTSGV